MKFFQGRMLAMATMHRKESVLAPKLEKTLGVTCVVPSFLDTDRFGTFSGEVARTHSIAETAKAKCDFVNSQYGYDLVLASEGTFGPHPQVPFLPSDHEYLLLKDYRNSLDITGVALSFTTNFNQRKIETPSELFDFAESVGFPHHALIIRSAQDSGRLIKGITNQDDLLTAFSNLIKIQSYVWVETDMRAHFNPTRMKIIEEAADSLIKNSMSVCPTCHTPGYVITDILSGLPCQLCGLPTQSMLKQIRRCQCCFYVSESWYPEGKKNEDPGYCDNCNP